MNNKNISSLIFSHLLADEDVACALDGEHLLRKEACMAKAIDPLGWLMYTFN